MKFFKAALAGAALVGATDARANSNGAELSVQDNSELNPVILSQDSAFEVAEVQVETSNSQSEKLAKLEKLKSLDIATNLDVSQVKSEMKNIRKIFQDHAKQDFLQKIIVELLNDYIAKFDKFGVVDKEKDKIAIQSSNDYSASAIMSDAKNLAYLKSLLGKEITRDESEFYTNFGYNFFMLGKYDRAIEFCNLSIKAGKNLKESYAGLAECYRAKGDEKQAQQNERIANMLPPTQGASNPQMLKDYKQSTERGLDPVIVGAALMAVQLVGTVIAYYRGAQNAEKKEEENKSANSDNKDTPSASLQSGVNIRRVKLEKPNSKN